MVEKVSQRGAGRCHCVRGVNRYGTQILTEGEGKSKSGGKSKSSVQEESWQQGWQEKGDSRKTLKGESGFAENQDKQKPGWQARYLAMACVI